MSSQYDPVNYQQRRQMSAALIAELTKPFHRKLLDEAKNSLTSSQNEIAVVLSQAASEMCTEWAITGLFGMRGDQDLAEPILALFLSYDICNDRLHRIYLALSGDSPNQRPFWSQLKSHKDRRNDLVHRGKKPSPTEAEASVRVVEQYVLHVETVLANLQTK